MAVVGGSPYKSNVRERVQKSGLEGKEVDRVRAVNPEVAEHEFAVGETRPVDLLNANPHFAGPSPLRCSTRMAWYRVDGTQKWVVVTTSPTATKNAPTA